MVVQGTRALCIAAPGTPCALRMYTDRTIQPHLSHRDFLVDSFGFAIGGGWLGQFVEQLGKDAPLDAFVI
jgi:hypothetical protein